MVGANDPTTFGCFSCSTFLMSTTAETLPGTDPRNPGTRGLGQTAAIGYLPTAVLLVGFVMLWTLTNSVYGPTPQWSPAVGWWIRWMIAIGYSSTVFAIVGHTGARWVLAAFVVNHLVAIFGPFPPSNGLISLTHVVFWTPAVVMLVRGLRTLNRQSVYGVWHLLALATMVISLLFDYRDAFRYLFLSPAG